MNLYVYNCFLSEPAFLKILFFVYQTFFKTFHETLEKNMSSLVSNKMSFLTNIFKYNTSKNSSILFFYHISIYSLTNYNIYENLLLIKLISLLLKKMYTSKFIFQIWLNQTNKSYFLNKIYFRTYSLRIYRVVIDEVSYMYDYLKMIDLVTKITKLFKKYLVNIITISNKEFQVIHSICSKNACIQAGFNTYIWH